MSPVLRAIVDDDKTYDDPSEDLLFMLLEDLQDGTCDFFVVEALDRGPNTYIQATLSGPGCYLLERRATTEASHERVVTEDMALAHAALTAWAFPAAPPPDLVWTPGFP